MNGEHELYLLFLFFLLLPSVLFYLRLPLPPGAFSGLWENEETFQKLYFQKFPVRIMKSII